MGKQKLGNHILDKKKTRQTDQIVKNILMRAKPEWREQRSAAVAQDLDPENCKQDEEKKSWSGPYELG